MYNHYMKNVLLSMLLTLGCVVNAEDNYIEIGVTDVGSWDDYGNGSWVVQDSSHRSRQFISFHKELDNDFYLLGSHTKTKSNIDIQIDALEEKVSTFGVGYMHSLKSLDLYAELSAYRYTQSNNNVLYQFSIGNIAPLLSRSEVISIYSGLKRSGSMYRLGLRKELTSDVDIDISYGSYNNTSYGLYNILLSPNIFGKHRNKSIKLIKDFDDRFSLVLNYEKDGDGRLFRRANRSLSLRTKF